MFSFMKLAEKSAASMPNRVAAKGKDPLATAKGKILAAIDEQKKNLTLTDEGQKLPNTKKGNRTVSTWFSKAEDGYWTSLRYGQVTIQIGSEGAWFFSTAEKVGDFYDTVKEAIRSGEMDTLIGELQKKRSASLTGRTGKKAA